MHVLLLTRHYEDDPENRTYLHRAFDIDKSSLDGNYKSEEYVDLEDEAHGILQDLWDRDIKADIIELKT